MEWLPSATSIVISTIAGLISGYAIARTRRLARLNDQLGESLEVCGEVLEALERSHDPGRAVHARLAAAIEPTLIAQERKLEPSRRRAMAMALAGEMIETIRRAKLEVIDVDPRG